MSDATIPFEAFCSYVYKDEPLFRRLETHLGVLKRQGLISTWDAQQIIPGANRTEEIDQRLERASIILLLVSADFLASDYCYLTEMERALERHKADQARVIPIIISPCDWKHTPFASLQFLPRNERAVTTWDNIELAWNDVTTGIRQTIDDLQGNVSAPSPQESGIGRNRYEPPQVDASSEGLLALKKGAQALWDGGYSFAKKELRKAIEGIDEDARDKEAAQARYFFALALLGGKVPRIQGREIIQRVEELMKDAIRIHPCASYYRIFACIKKDYFEFNGLRSRLNEVATLESKGVSFPRSLEDEEMEEYFRQCQPRLSI